MMTKSNEMARYTKTTHRPTKRALAKRAAARARLAAARAELRAANLAATEACEAYGRRFPVWADLARRSPEAVAMRQAAEALVAAAQAASERLAVLSNELNVEYYEGSY